MKKIRVGVIGLGFIGKQHVEALRRLPYIEIVAGSDSNLSMREWCEKNGIQKYYSDYKEMGNANDCCRKSCPLGI